LNKSSHPAGAIADQYKLENKQYIMCYLSNTTSNRKHQISRCILPARKKVIRIGVLTPFDWIVIAQPAVHEASLLQGQQQPPMLHIRRKMLHIKDLLSRRGAHISLKKLSITAVQIGQAKTGSQNNMMAS
jgi:hypothetical protein